MKRHTLYRTAIVIGLGNYLLYALTALAWGGDALHGQIARGHYFVAEGDAYIEVSRALFLFCKWQAYSLLLTFPLGLLGAALLTPMRRDADEFTGGTANARLSPHAP